MAVIIDLAVDQTVLVVATVKSLDPDDRHFQGVTLKLTYPTDGVLAGEEIRVDPSQVTIPILT